MPKRRNASVSVVLKCLKGPLGFICSYFGFVIDEDLLIEAGLEAISTSRKKTSFLHYEEKFMKSGETVVIWCIRDFFSRTE
jgi:hypothetical protein